MSSRVDLLTSELDDLHRGRGIHAPAVGERLGPTLRELIYGDNEPDEAESRSLIRATLVSAAEVLPLDLARVFRAGLGVDDTAPLLTERLERLGRSMDRGNRTMSRRLTEADRAVAQVLERRALINDDRNPFATKGWYVDRLESHAVIGRRPRFTGVRDIKFTHDNVRYLCESFSVPHSAGTPAGEDLTVEAIEGAELVEVNRFSVSCWQLTIHLPHAFKAMETHRVGIAVTMPSRSFVRPYNALVAVRRTRSFHASVTFDPDTDVGAVWSYDGVPPLSIEDGVPTDRMLDLGTGRSVAADWPIVRQGLAYGIGWS
ncbi:hypothetical protein OHA70_03855 [Kribbella sp. NBC_00382]|uniref:hypothetical protein n=1 Tax=Kribbella sp. NBC_00382 TaxID=2975967 RepID=UPI002E1C5296